jgi:N-acyl-L-homoserine lactone synthetase
MIDASKLVQEGPNAGSEMPDEDDARSVHFGVLENLGDAVRLVGSMRHIVKGQNSDAPLPVELFFPQAFQDGDGKAPVGSFEVSRYIQRHEDLALQQLMTKPLLGKALTFALARGEEPAFGVVEEALERRLMKVGVPLKRIADPMMVPEYAADNLGIQIDLHEMGRRFGINPKVIAAARRQENQFTYFGTAPHIPVTGVA